MCQARPLRRPEPRCGSRDLGDDQSCWVTHLRSPEPLPAWITMAGSCQEAFEQVSRDIVAWFFLLFFDNSAQMIVYANVHPPPTPTPTLLLSSLSCILLFFSYKRNSVSLWHLSGMKRVRGEKLPLSLGLFNVLYEKILNCIKLS